MSSQSSATRILGLIVALVVVAGLIYLALQIFSGGGAATPTPVLCPQATPEFFYVEPVTSPTDLLSQVITVDLGNGETITITTESGTFTAPFDTFPKGIEITLLPNTTHNLTVQGKVKEIVQGECTYGGYMLETTRDRDGNPLVIEQKQP